MNWLTGLLVVSFLVTVAFLVSEKFRDWLTEKASERNSSLWKVAALLIVCNVGLAIYENRIGIYQWIFLVYLCVPTVIATVFKRRGSKWDLLVDLVIICWMWIPNDFGLNPIFKSWGGGMFGYALTAFTGMAYIIILFTGWRKVDLGLD